MFVSKRHAKRNQQKALTGPRNPRRPLRVYSASPIGFPSLPSGWTLNVLLVRPCRPQYWLPVAPEFTQISPTSSVLQRYDGPSIFTTTITPATWWQSQITVNNKYQSIFKSFSIPSAITLMVRKRENSASSDKYYSLASSEPPHNWSTRNMKKIKLLFTIQYKLLGSGVSCRLWIV